MHCNMGLRKSESQAFMTQMENRSSLSFNLWTKWSRFGCPDRPTNRNELTSIYFQEKKQKQGINEGFNEVSGLAMMFFKKADDEDRAGRADKFVASFYLKAKLMMN